MPLPTTYYKVPSTNTQGLRRAQNPYLDLQSSSQGSEEAKALRTGALGLRAGVENAVAAAGYAVGADEFAARRQAEAERIQQEAAQVAPKLQRLEQAQTPADYLQLATNVTLQNLPLIASTALSSLTGGVVGAALKASRAGAVVGAAAPYFASSVGENFSEYSQDPNAGTPQQKGAVAVAAAVPQTLLGMAPVAGVAHRALAPGLSLAKRVAQGAAVGAGSEATTETLEEVTQKFGHHLLNPNTKLTDSQALSDYLNAAFGGAVVGGAFGGLGAGAGHVVQTPATVPVDVQIPAQQGVSAAEGFAPMAYLNLLRDAGIEPNDQERVDAVRSTLEAVRDNPQSLTGEDLQGLRQLVASIAPDTPEMAQATRLYNALAQVLPQPAAPYAPTGTHTQEVNPELDEEGNLVGDPTEDSTKFDDGLDEQTVEPQSTYLYNEKTGLPYVGRHLGEGFSGASKRLAELNLDPGPYRFSEVSLRQAVEQEAKTQSDPATYIRQKARGLAKVKKEYRHLYDDTDPAAFLDNFTVVKKEPYAPDVRRVEPTSLLKEDLVRPMAPETARLVARMKQEGRTEEARRLEIAHEGSQLVRMGARGWRGMKSFPVTVDGKQAQVSAMNLVKRMMLVNDNTLDEMPLKDRVGRHFLEGLASLLSAPDAKVELARKIPDELVLFRTNDGQEVRYGEVKTVGWRALEAKRQAIQREHNKAQSEVQTDRELLRQPYSQRKRGDMRKDETLQRDIAANQRRMADLQRQFDNVSNILDQADRTLKKAEPRRYAGTTEYGTESDVAAGQGVESIAVPTVPKEPITKRNARGYADVTEERFEENRGPDEEKSYADSEYMPGEWKRPQRARRLLNALQYLDLDDARHTKYAQEVAGRLLGVRQGLDIKRLRKFAEGVAGGKEQASIPSRLDSVSQTVRDRAAVIGTVLLNATESDVPRARTLELTADQKKAIRSIQKKINSTKKEAESATESELRVAREKLEGLQGEWSDLVASYRRKADVSRAEGQTLDQQLTGLDSHLVSRATEQVAAWTKQFRLAAEPRVMGIAEAMRFLRANGRTDEYATLLRGTLHGFTATDNGKVVMFVHPSLEASPALWNEVLAHEFGHAIFKTEAVLATDEQAAAVFKAYLRWKAGLGEAPSIEAVIGSKKPAAMLANLLDVYAGQQLSELTEKSRDYLLNFEEWFADNVSKQLTTTKPPQNLVERFFRGIADKVRAFFGQLAPDMAVEQFLQQLTSRKSYVLREKSAWKVAQQAFSAAEGASLQKAVDGLKSVHWRLSKLRSRDLTKVLWASFLTREGRIGNATNQMLGDVLPVLLKPEELRVLGRAATSSHVRDQLARLLKNSQAAIGSLAYPDEAVGYMYQLWSLGLLHVGPETTTVSGKIKDVLSKAFGFVRDSEQAAAVMQALKNGDVMLRGEGYDQVILPPAPQHNQLQRAAGKLVDLWHNNGEWFRAGFFPAVSRIYRTGNPALVWMMEQFFARTGREGVKKTYFEARREQFGRFDNIVSDYIFAGKDEEHGRAVLEVLQNPDLMDKSTADVQDTVRRVRKYVFDDIRKYLTEAGVELGDRGKDYFPWVFDTEYLTEHSDEFKALLGQSKFTPFFEKLRKAYAEREAERATRGLSDQAEADRVTAAVTNEWAHTDMVDYFYGQLASNNGYADAQPVDTTRLGHNPSFRFMNHRDLWFLQDQKTASPEDRVALSQFFQKNLGLTLRTYMEQAVKRAEYVRRFGPNGELLREQLAKAKQYGATDKELALAWATMDAMLGTAGYETNRKLAKLMGWPEPPPGEIINPGVNKVMGGVMVYQNLRLLSLATLSSAIDPIGIAVRTGDLGMALRSFKDGVKAAYAMVQGRQDDLKDLGELLGTIDRHMTNEALGQEYGGLYLTGWGRKLNEGMFKWNGLQAWTQTTRLMALAAAKAFLAKHAKRPNNASERYFAELGLSPGDLRFNGRGGVTVLSYQARQRADGSELARDDRVRNALNRFVDEAILRPDAAQRPVWASDPHFMLLFHLKSYMYSFHERILRRVAHELGHGNLMPLLYLGWYIPVMIAADLLRDLVQFGTNGNPRKASWSTMDYIANAAERAGLPGNLQMVMDAQQDRDFGGWGIESLAGPTVQQLKSLATGQATFESMLPGQNAWRAWND